MRINMNRYIPRKPKDIIIDGRTLEDILIDHKHWIDKDIDDWESKRAYLPRVDLSYVDLEYRDLRCATLHYSNFNRAFLIGTNIRYAGLYGCNFVDAKLDYANIEYANLQNSNLFNASITDANLRNANLCNANLRNTNLADANLSYASLIEANFKDSQIIDTIFYGSYLIDSKNLPYIPMVCPEEGAFIGWKKAAYSDFDGEYHPVLVQLYIPEDAKRSSATSRKCRCNKAKVLDMRSIRENIPLPNNITIHSGYDKNFIYKVGETVEVEDFDEDRWNECSAGIHFFMNRQEAIEY
jgi:uncharacterized protein YjbI with pentapeptide repeats